MERNAPYALIAAFVLAGLAVGAGLLVWLTDYDPGRRVATYAVVFDDVSGLSLASEVRYNGLPVGEVATMALDPAGTGLIRVEIEVLEGVPLRQGAVARLSTQGVTGVAVVALEGGDPRAPPLDALPQDVPMLQAGRGAVETLADEAPALLEEARVLVADLRAFVTPENAGRVARVLTELERSAAGLGEIGALVEDLGGIGLDLAPALRGLPEALAGVEAAAAETEALAASLRAIAEDRVPGLVATAEKALTEIGETTAVARARLEEAEEPIARLSEAGRALADAARSGDRLMQEVTGLASGAAPILDDASVVSSALRQSLPEVLDDATSVASALGPLAQDRLPALAGRAEAALGAIETAAATAQARLEEAGPTIAAATDLAEGLGALVADARPLPGLAGATIAELRPAIADAAAAGAALRADLPAALSEARRAAETVGMIASDRLPTLVDRAEAALGAAASAARTTEAQVAGVGAALEAPLTEGGAALSALADAARAVEGASGQVGDLASDVAPTMRELAAAGTRLAGSAEAIAGRTGPILDELATLVAEARGAVGTTGTAVADIGRAAPGLDRTLRETAAAAEAVRRLAQRLARDPSILIRGR